MKIITNQKTIKRNKRIGQITTFVSIGILGLGLYLSFQQLYINWSFVALLAGFLLSQVGIYYGSRWGRSPRPDELLNQALKGLDNKYSIYHYSAPVPHLLLGPAGMWILSPYAQRGTITYDKDKNRLRQKGGNLYLKIFAQEGLGRPDIEIKNLERTMKKYLEKNHPDITEIFTGSILVFTNEKTTIEAENSPVPIVSAKKLKDFIRRQAKITQVDTDFILKIEKDLPTEQ